MRLTSGSIHQLKIFSWRDAFSQVYRTVRTHCHIQDDEIASTVGVSIDAVRQYTGARKSIPANIEPLCELFEKKVNALDSMSKRELLKDICSLLQIDCNINDADIGQYLSAQLNKCFSNTKNKSPFTFIEETQEPIPSSGHIQAVVFDFDGTLTKTKSHTTWESLWKTLGYDIEECRALHKRFDKQEFSHQTWCDITAEKFKEKGLTRNHLVQLAKEIKLISGCAKTLQELRIRNIHMFIVSGSIKSIIQDVLGSVYYCFDDIQANEFRFDIETHLLDRIIGTEYDFEGKAKYVSDVAKRLHLSTADILFVGNSNNDVHVYKSGAKTLCINPVITDYHDDVVWNECIVECTNLLEILPFIT